MVDEVSSLKEEVWKHFKEKQVIYLASSEEDQPRVRPVTLLRLDGRFWILTGTNTAKTQQIRKNPKIEICLFLEKGGARGYVRAAGLAAIISERETKARIAERCDYFKEYWESPDDPSYALIEFSFNEIEYMGTDEDTVRKFKI